MVTGVEVDIIIKLIVAAVLGSIVGFERELHHNPAGFRTQALVCMGAALFTLLPSAFSGYNADPLRMAAGVVTGIGFLAAGIIFRSENKVHGLTTAAEIWAMAAVGVAVGMGLYYAAIAATVLILVILGPLKAVEETEEKRAKKKGGK